MKTENLQKKAFNQIPKANLITMALALILISSCATQTNDEIVYEPLKRDANPKELIAEVINEELLLSRQSGLYPFESYVAIIGDHDNNMIHIYDVETGEKVRMGGRKGNSHTELGNFVFMHYANGNHISFLTQGNELYKTLDFSRIAKGNDDGLIGSAPRNELGYPVPAYPLKGGRILIQNRVGGESEEATRFEVIDGDSLVMRYSGIRDFMEDKENNEQLYGPLGSEITLKPDNSKIVFWTKYGCVLEILDIKVDTIVSSALKGYIKPSFEYVEKSLNDGKMTIFTVEPTNESVMAIKSLYPTDKYIYTLYTEALVKSEDQPNPALVIFDWKGRYVKEYKLDRKLQRIGVDEKANKVYGIAEEDGILSLVSYDM